jgi:hypothetical protein
MKASLGLQRELFYSKWYQGRATFFSRELFTALLCLRCVRSDPRRKLSIDGEAYAGSTRKQLAAFRPRRLKE